MSRQQVLRTSTSTKKMKYLIILIELVMSLTGSGQQIMKCDSSKSYWIFEKNNAVFSVKLIGNISEQEKKSVIAVNGYVLQYVIVDKKDYIRADSNMADLNVLTNYALSEAEYMTVLLKQKLNIQMQKAPLSSDKTALIWFFEMPLNVSQEVKHQIFVNIIIGDQIIGFSSSQFADQKLDDVKNFLMDAISTLKQVKDIDKLCEQ